MLENLRVGLLRWNVAPLTIVAVLMGLTCWMTSVLLAMPPCNEGSNGIYIALSGLITVMAGLLFKMYESMQKDRGDKQ